jgi:hypothetical protein
VPGTNKFAVISRAWRDASEDDDQQLQLHLHLAALNDQQLQRSEQWLVQHGRTVTALEVDGAYHSQPTWRVVHTVLSSPGVGSSLQRLCIQGSNSLVGLLAAKVQLPHLQHLTAWISQHMEWQADADVVMLANGNQAAGVVHPLHQACPGLMQLRLHLSVDHMPWLQQQPRAMFSSVDDLLPRLLPPTLQRLCLSCDGPYSIHPGTALGHITALRQMELHRFELVNPGSLLQLPSQCTFGLFENTITHQPGSMTTPDQRVLIFQRVTAMELDSSSADLASLAYLPRLARLSIVFYCGSTVLPLAGMTALQQLKMVSWGRRWVQESLLQATSCSNLRHLVLSPCDDEETVSAVGALTQLTFLYIEADAGPEPTTCLRSAGQGGQQQQQLLLTGVAASGFGKQLGGGPDGAGGMPGRLLPALQGLVELCQLQLSAAYLVTYPTAWLGHLTQLTVLVCEERTGYGEEQLVLSNCLEALVPRLQGNLPASLQQLVLYLQDVPVCDVVPSPLPCVSVGVRIEPDSHGVCTIPQGPRSMQPCPHLPGVWELIHG